MNWDEVRRAYYHGYIHGSLIVCGLILVISCLATSPKVAEEIPVTGIKTGGETTIKADGDVTYVTYAKDGGLAVTILGLIGAIFKWREKSRMASVNMARASVSNAAVGRLVRSIELACKSKGTAKHVKELVRQQGHPDDVEVIGADSIEATIRAAIEEMNGETDEEDSKPVCP
jgi:hypothetical protein